MTWIGATKKKRKNQRLDGEKKSTRTFLPKGGFPLVQQGGGINTSKKRNEDREPSFCLMLQFISHPGAVEQKNKCDETSVERNGRHLASPKPIRQIWYAHGRTKTEREKSGGKNPCKGRRSSGKTVTK